MITVLAVVGFVLLLTILWMLPRVIDAIILLFERRRPLDPAERARVALAAHYSRINGMSDADLAGLPPLRRQSIWNLLAEQWGIRGVRSRKRALSHQVLDWLKDAGARADPRFAPPPGCDPNTRQQALLAWDCARLVFFSRLCFFAGYIEEADAWQYIRVAARNLGSTFHSWTSYGEALLAARELWTGPAGTELAGAISTLLETPNSPWQQYAWNSAVGA